MNRILWIVGGDARRLKLAALCQFTLPGPPIIYYGTEIGLSQVRDVRSADGSGHPEESRLPMPWAAQDTGLLDFYRRLVAARREMGGLWRGARRTIAIDDDAGLLVYGYANADAEVAVVLHAGEGVTAFRPGEVDMWHLGLTTDDGANYADGVLTLPALSGAILQRQPRR
jgi:glycosidase